MKAERIIIVILLLIVATLGYHILRLQQEHERIISPFFEYEFEPERNIVITRWKSTKKVHEFAYDRNQDLADDSIITLGDPGSSATTWIDDDFDGRFEVSYLIDKDGRCFAKYEDTEQNGYSELFTSYTMDSVFTYRDANEDGRFDNSELISVMALR